ncbi:ClbS/DfsB family four-helix bundle protein [Gleimia hominis]|uniref:ClbS/DfsB family four-helix bundle protein n=1 Tax=Gleimia hominis TaxID=595468 RepID=A0ABU3I9N2_9ACTO|nr:ClbS/DfsB family four-helix bundle protein [Gleimia hominis]MDT3767082.1 ClbS/DfsB family four-helix bundle protein [Gleimia hominis]
MNQEIWEQYQDVSLDKIQALLTTSHTQTVELIEGFTGTP